MRFLLRHAFACIVLVSVLLLGVFVASWKPYPDSRDSMAGFLPTGVSGGTTAQVVSSTLSLTPSPDPGLLPPTPASLPTVFSSISISLVEQATIPADPTPESPRLRLLFTGDINPGRCLAQAALIADDFTIPYRYVAAELSSADLTVGSLDGSISDLTPPGPCQEITNLVGPARTREGLAFAGFDVLSVATNHALDCGLLGWRCHGQVLRDTRENLLSVGITPVGSGENLFQARSPVIIELQGVRFAFLAVNAISGDATWADGSQPGTAPLSDATIADVSADIRAARSRADVVIVLPHWGVEYQALPTAGQRTWAAEMIAAGADLVIGNHPHVIQPVQTFPNGGVVAYALGNFVFDQGTLDTRQGLVFEAVFRGSTLESWHLLPVKINKFSQPVWADADEAETILNRVVMEEQGLSGH